MNIVLSSAGTRNEVYPMIALASELRKRQHWVVLCVPEKYRSMLMQLEFRMITCGSSFEEFLAGERAGDASGFVKRLAAEVPAQFVAMRDALLEADLLVCGGFMAAGASLAEQKRIPYFYMIQTPPYLDPARHPFGCMPARKKLFESTGRIRSEWQSLLGGALNRERQNSGLNPVKDVHNYFFRSGHVLISVDSEVAPVSAGTGETVTGFWNFALNHQPDVEDFLSAGAAPVLVERLPLQAEVAPVFIRQLCEHLAAANIRVCLSSDWPAIEGSALPQGCRLVEAGPDQRMAAVVHAGTPQTFAAAAYAGVPQATVPQMQEHVYWGERIAAIGVGPAPVMRADAADVARVVKEIIASNSYRSKSGDLAKRLNTQNGPAVAADTLEKFGGDVGHGS